MHERGVGGRRPFIIGCVLLVLTGLAHALGQLAGPAPAGNDTEKTLVELMTTYEFNMLGRHLTLMTVMVGFGWMFSVAFLMQGVGGLVLMRGSWNDVALVRRLAALNLIFLVLALLVAVIFFPQPPIAFIVAAIPCFALAVMHAPRKG